MLFATPNQQCQNTEGSAWRTKHIDCYLMFCEKTTYVYIHCRQCKAKAFRNIQFTKYNTLRVIPRRKHHGQAAEVTTGDSHQYSTNTIQVIIAKQDWQCPLLRLKVAEHKEWYEYSTQHHRQPSPPGPWLRKQKHNNFFNFITTQYLAYSVVILSVHPSIHWCN